MTLIQNAPLLTCSLVVGFGYLLGCVNIFGFRLRVAGVLFTGLGVGAGQMQLVNLTSLDYLDWSFLCIRWD